MGAPNPLPPKSACRCAYASRFGHLGEGQEFCRPRSWAQVHTGTPSDETGEAMGHAFAEPDFALTPLSPEARRQAEMVPADQAFETVLLRVNTAAQLRGVCGDVLQ